MMRTNPNLRHIERRERIETACQWISDRRGVILIYAVGLALWLGVLPTLVYWMFGRAE